MPEKEKKGHNEKLIQALKAAVTEPAAPCFAHDSREMMRRRLLEINEIVKEALNGE